MGVRRDITTTIGGNRDCRWRFNLRRGVWMELRVMEPRIDDPRQWLLVLLSILMLVFCLTAP